MKENVMANLVAMREKRQQWQEKFDSATAEEQERMLAEKKADEERIERERKERIERDDKNKFVDSALAQIRVYKALKETFPKVMETIKSFDGKILNRRLTNVIAEKLGKDFTVTLEDFSWASYIRINYLAERAWDYQAEFKLHVDTDYRINARETELPQLDEQIISWQKAVKSYDKYLKVAKKIKKAMEDYGNEVPWQLRDVFKKNLYFPSHYF